MAHDGTGPGDALDEARSAIATGCRVVARSGLSPGVLGHLSLRLPDGRVLVRCRGPRERGLAYTEAQDVHAVGPGGTGAAAGWQAPNELPIHTRVLHARPDVSVVLHAHPPAVVTTTLAHRPLLPIVGAYDIPAAQLAAGGIPVWPRSALVNDDELGDAVAHALGDRPAVLLHGHGLVSVGRGPVEHAVAEAVVTALAVDTLARLTLAVLAAGAEPAPIDDADLAQLPQLGPGLHVETAWRHLVASTDAASPPAQP
ncbi:class II aldolase/adducin family protein [uncultured Jatrophihabitans sp.]|uniref:class II aldolase/adducin family protein n=1 Tax=uncultured Jatrophihabitans sp. TaxID=1610747 RepID=UPI0035CBA5F3